MTRIFVTIVVLCVAAGGAAAQSAAQAEQLFRDGKRLMSEGKLAEACDAFELSYRKDPVLSTLLNLADCREKNGQYATAWGYFLDAERLARAPGGEAFLATAQARAGRLAARVSSLTIRVPAESALDGLVITRNGVAIDRSEWNRALPVDGGEHTVTGKAPGHETWSQVVTVGRDADKKAIDVPRLKPAAVDAEPVEEPVVATAPAGGSGRKTIGKIALAGGGALVLGGLAAGYLARSKWGEVKTLCGDDLICPPGDYETGKDLAAAARLRGNVSTVLVGAGVVTAAVGTVLWLTAPRAPSSSEHARLRPSLEVGPDAIVVTLGGAL